MLAVVAVEVQVAALGALGLVAAAGLGAIPSVMAKRAGEKAADAIGTPNGQGNVVQMLERILAGQTGQDNRLANLEAHQHDHEIRLAGIEGRLRPSRVRQDQPPGSAA